MGFAVSVVGKVVVSAVGADDVDVGPFRTLEFIEGYTGFLALFAADVVHVGGMGIAPTQFANGGTCRVFVRDDLSTDRTQEW